MSQQDYFTGNINNYQPASTDQSSPQHAAVPIIQKQQINQHNQSQKPQQSDSQQQQQQFVDAKQITVENEQVDDDLQKFISSNPELANQQKLQGNKSYSQGQYSNALASYRKSLQHTNNTDDSSQQDKKFRSIIYSNIGLTYMKMLDDSNAIPYFKKSLELNENYAKARTNLGQCYENTDKLEEALDQYKRVLEMSPSDGYVRQKVMGLEVKVKELQEKRKEEVMSGLKNLGNTVLGYFGMSLDNFKFQQGPSGGYNISFKQ